ncbi:unnamed protein product [Phytomonas sp. Hart1]|nr:unnamed protein product [Phytomonas sp. Hart1]|eukprot:CCW71153.1 unnamed protein product [Phytomonas sp. isolate Hart1]
MKGIFSCKDKNYKSCDAARSAFKNRDIEASRSEHNKPMNIESHNSSTSEYIKSIVFGGLDGIMTCFAVISAAAGSNGNYTTVLIFGFSNVIADGFTMGFGEYISGAAERENAMAERMREEWEVENAFDMEVDEMIQIYMDKGLSFEDASTIVSIISKDHKVFVDFMMVEELGLLLDIDDPHGPKKQGTVMAISFICFGLVPLFAYLFGKGQGMDRFFVFSALLTMFSLILLGILKGYLVGISMFKSAFLMVLNGLASGVISFTIGYLIEAGLRREVSV